MDKYLEHIMETVIESDHISQNASTLQPKHIKFLAKLYHIVNAQRTSVAAGNSQF